MSPFCFRIVNGGLNAIMCVNVCIVFCHVKSVSNAKKTYVKILCRLMIKDIVHNQQNLI